LLPASDEAFNNALEEKACPLQTVLSQKSAAYSSFAGRVLAAHIFYRIAEHTSLRTQDDDDAKDVKNGSYWNRYRRIDNDLATMLMFLPDSLRLSRSHGCLNATFVNISVQTSIICLHQSALAKVDALGLPEHLKQQSAVRLLPAAQEILSALRMAAIEIEAVMRNPMIAFSAYMAALVLVKDSTEGHNRQSVDDLDFLLELLTAVGRKNVIVWSLAVQLGLELKRSGISVDVGKVTLRILSFAAY
jgi:hypothetical protein